nr:retrovirus-related Pol polyprotein from transposon TNT 1-94 [Tanacetum cinerariifolium]
MKCYNCNGTGHIARNCTQPKRPQNSEYFKDKMLLMQAQENGVALDAEQLLFLVDPVTDEAGPSYDSDILSEHFHHMDSSPELYLAAPEHSEPPLCRLVLWLGGGTCVEVKTGDDGEQCCGLETFDNNARESTVG